MTRGISCIALFISACAGPLENPERFETCEPAAAERLLVAKCGSCHGATDPDGNLDLASPDPASRMLGVASTEETPCKNRQLISATGSHLLLDRIPASSCGEKMPVDLSEEESTCLKDWADGVAGVP